MTATVTTEEKIVEAVQAFHHAELSIGPVKTGWANHPLRQDRIGYSFSFARGNDLRRPTGDRRVARHRPSWEPEVLRRAFRDLGALDAVSGGVRVGKRLVRGAKLGSIALHGFLAICRRDRTYERQYRQEQEKFRQGTPFQTAIASTEDTNFYSSI